MNLTDVDDRVAAAVIAAAGTVIGALLQLRIAWRREVAERVRGAPVTKKSRRGPVWAVGLLLLAAAVGGFALSQSLVIQSSRDAASVRAEIDTRLQQIGAAAERLERTTLREHESSGRVTDGRDRADSVAVTTSVGPCRAQAAATASAAPPCTEAEALPTTLCATLPAAASVTEAILYARLDESHQAWNESRVAPGEDVGRARFLDKPFERAQDDQTREVCARFASWDSERAYTARLVVVHVLPAPSAEFSRVSLVPTAGAAQ
jgi:hypothetical protein